VVKRMEKISNHLAMALAVTLVGQGGKVKSTTASLTAGQSKSAQCRVGRGSMTAGRLSVTMIGMWSDSVEGRGISQEVTKR